MGNEAEPFAEIVQSLREIVAQLATIEAALKRDPAPSNPPQVTLDEPRAQHAQVVHRAHL